MDNDARTDDNSAKTFKQQFGPTYYSYNRGEVHYVVPDDVFFLGAHKKYIGYITENQLQWLEQDLAHVKLGTTVVISLHIPTFTGQAKCDNKVEEAQICRTNNRRSYLLCQTFTNRKRNIGEGYRQIWQCLSGKDHDVIKVPSLKAGAFFTHGLNAFVCKWDIARARC